MSTSPAERILVVESDPDVSDLIARQALQPLGYQVSVAADGGSAIRQALQFQPDVMLVALNLQGLSGKDLLVALSSQGITTPVIVLAKKGEEPAVIQAFRLGANDYLMLPAREAEVVSAVERTLKQVRESRSREKLDKQLKQMNDELQHRLRELTTIFAVGRAVISITDQRVLFEKIVEAVTTVTEADLGWLTLKDEKTKAFLLVSQRNLPDAWAKKIGQPLDDGVSSLVAMSAEVLAIQGEPMQKFKISALGKSVMVVPVKVHNEAIGLLIVVRKTARPFGESEQTLAGAIADYASISLVNARLFRALAHNAETAQSGEKHKNESLQNLRQEVSSSLQTAAYPLDLVLSEKTGALNAEQKQALENVQTTIKRLVALVSQNTQPRPPAWVKINPMSKTDLILLAMEETPTLALLERALHASGYAVATAKDAASVDKSLMETSPMLMLITDQLDGKPGLSLAAGILERFPTLPVILFSSRDDPQLVKKALRAGLSDVIHPPLRIDEIVQAIKHSLKRAEQMGDWVRREVRRTTASLEQRVNEMETLVKLGRSITSSLDIDSVLTSVVTAAVELTGAEEGQLLLLDETTNELYMRAGRNFEENFARTFRLPVKDSLAGQVLHTGKPVSFNEDSPNKIKTSYLVYSLIYVPLHAQDRVAGVLGVDNRQHNRPFSQHHELLMTILSDYAAIAIQNAQSYQNSETERTKFGTILDSIQNGVILLDKENRILLINPAAQRAFGLGFSDLLGVPVLEAIQHHDFGGLLESISDNPLKFYEIAFDDGRVFSAQYTPIEAIGAVITLEDITHLKMLDRLKNDFIHTISHDLRSPLTSIMGYVELLERVGPLTDQQKEFIRHVQNSIQSITALVNDLLDLGLIEAGFDTRKDEVALETVLRYTLENLGKQIEDKEQDLQLNIAEHLPLLRGNPIRLRQMTDNLLVNAIKYTPERGTLIVNLRLENGQIIFEVADTGVGIPAADQPHIFEKFYRAGNAPKGTPGTGLGLAIVKSIVDNHQGRIWVESTVGKGTKFTVVLPAFSETETPK